MKIKINNEAKYYNCHWYCMNVGKVYNATFDSKINCYVVKIKNVPHLVSKNHAYVV